MERKLSTWGRAQEVRLVVLFGSWATGKVHPGSDVEVAVWQAGELTSELKLRLWRELDALLERDVSLVIVSPDLVPVLRMEIVRHGRLMYEREPGSWIEAKRRLWHGYNLACPSGERCGSSSMNGPKRFAEMPPEVLSRKLIFLRQLLADLEPFRGASPEQVREDHYTLERLFELLVATSTDILFHELSERDIAPDSHRDAFRKAAEIKLITGGPVRKTPGRGRDAEHPGPPIRGNRPRHSARLN